MKSMQGAETVLLFVATLLALRSPLVLGGGSGNSFLLISSSSQKAVLYARLLTPAEQARGDKMSTQVLAKEGQLEDPMGLAADSLRGLVYVADPTAGAVFVMRVYEEGRFRSGKLASEEPRVVLSGVAPRWVAVDAMGTLLVSDANNNRIWSLPAKVALNIAMGSMAPQIAGSTASKDAVELYSSGTLTSSPALQDPQGIAADGSHVFWANGAGGTTDGSVVQAPKDSDDDRRGEAAASLANNADATTGICLSGSRLFYTDGATNVYSVPTSGGDVLTVSSGFQSAQGCAYDGDGTVFVADEAEGRVYAFSGKAADLTARPLSLVVDSPGAVGLAVLSSSWHVRPRIVGAFAVLATLMAACAQQ